LGTNFGFQLISGTGFGFGKKVRYGFRVRKFSIRVPGIEYKKSRVSGGNPDIYIGERFGNFDLPTIELELCIDINKTNHNGFYNAIWLYQIGPNNSTNKILKNKYKIYAKKR
jgi:hypothetical protein